MAEPPMAQFAQPRFLPQNAVSYGHSVQHFPLFAHGAPADCREIASSARMRVRTLPDALPARPSSPRRGHGHVGQGTIVKLVQNGAEVVVRLAGRGESVEVIRFCGLLLGARAQYREYGCPSDSRARGAFSTGFQGNVVHDEVLGSRDCLTEGTSKNYLHLARFGMVRKSAFTAGSVRLSRIASRSAILARHLALPGCGC